MPRNQRMNHLADTVRLDTAAPPRPLYGPWVMASTLSAAARTESGNLDQALRRRSDGLELPRPPPHPKPASSGFGPFRQS